ncbi:MAG: hypothetical protein Q9195_000637 [Heterodermia aff. obscurata]
MQLTVLSAVVPLLSIALAKTTKIDVGEGGLKFDPDTVTADKGDVLEFHFYPEDHSVAQSTFDKPCIADETGVWSGFMPVTTGVGNETFSVTINSTDPLWLYCSQGQHCNAGMAMVVNEPKSGNTLAAYKAAAKDAKPTSPQGNYHGGVVASATNSTSNSTSASTSASSTPSGTASTQGSGTSTAPASTSTTGAAVKLETAGLAVLGLAGLVVGGMI